MKKYKQASSGAAEVNMTPMLDIVFIMLIFFIVTATFVREVGLDVTQHHENDDDNTIDNAKAIVLQVCADNDILIDRRAIDVRTVRANVERKLAENPNATVIIEAEPEAPTGNLVQTMDQAIAARASVSVAPAHSRCGDLSSATAAHKS